MIFDHNKCLNLFLDTDGYEFLIVSLDNKQWQFEANSSEDRDEWVAAIEQQILNSLQVSDINNLCYHGCLYFAEANAYLTRNKPGI